MYLRDTAKCQVHTLSFTSAIRLYIELLAVHHHEARKLLVHLGRFVNCRQRNRLACHLPRRAKQSLRWPGVCCGMACELNGSMH